MEVTCLRKDKAFFEDELGFVDQEIFTNDCELVELVCEGANYGYYDDVPKDVPFLARGGPGSCYGEFMYACDGEKLWQVQSNAGTPVVSWDMIRNAPNDRQTKEVKGFVECERKVKAMFDKLKLKLKRK
jgi:hypothetical protein